MKEKITCLIAFIILMGINLGFTQDKPVKYFKQDLTTIKEEEKLQSFADFYFEMKDYLNALPLYVKLDQRYPGRLEFLYKAGICYLHKPVEREKSIKYLEKVMKMEPKTKDLPFYLGRANHINYHFDKAIDYYDFALNNENLAAPDKILIKRLIENCKNGKNLIKNQLDVRIENIGHPVNTEDCEYFPVIPSDESFMIFTYSGKKSTGGLQEEFGQSMYFEDILISRKSGNNWLEPVSIGENINTPGSESCISLSADGKKLFIYKFTEDASGEIFLSKLENNIWSSPERLKGDVNSLYWEGGASISADGKTLYFTSERPGGYGGADIYNSTITSDGSWGKAVNLGPVINTQYNDESPFIHSDGKTLYFSSEGHSSMGKYDIFYTTLQDDGTWTIPENIGYPINSTDNDRHYIVSTDGKRGYYFSEKTDGYGQPDIYIVYLDQPAKKKEEIKKEKEKEKLAVKDAHIAKTEIQKEKPAGGEKLTEDVVTQLNITGKILFDEQPGKPAPGTKIFITDKSTSVTNQTVTDKNGNFSFKKLPGSQNYDITLLLDKNLTISKQEIPGEKQKEEVKPTAKTGTPDKTKTTTPPKESSRTVGKGIKTKPVIIKENPADAGSITLDQAIICRSVENLTPVNEGTDFPSNTGRLYLFTNVTLDAGVSSSVYHAWYYGNQEMGKVKLEVAGPHWRTYSYKTINPSSTGDWRVDVTTDDNKVIKSVSFQIK
ncbi:MAG: DUF2914 domain-containing protein [Bacteroidota bacterium]